MIMLPPEVRAEVYLTSVRVFIDDTLHLMFRRGSFVALQSWPDESCFSIEVAFANGPPLHMKYEKKETWRHVLFALAELDITAVESKT